MAVPKGKVSKARRNSRRAANWKLQLPGIVKCPRCSKMKLAHHVCKNCGEEFTWTVCLRKEYVEQEINMKAKCIYCGTEQKWIQWIKESVA